MKFTNKQLSSQFEQAGYEGLAYYSKKAQEHVHVPMSMSGTKDKVCECGAREGEDYERV